MRSSTFAGISMPSPDISRRCATALAGKTSSGDDDDRDAFMPPLTAPDRSAADPLDLAARLARLERLVQRQTGFRETVLQVGPLQLDLIDRIARRDERIITLLLKEFRLLRYMMEHSGQLLKRATLLEDVWHYKFIPKTNLVDVHIGRLRHKVDGANEAPMIHNVRGAGFILRAPG